MQGDQFALLYLLVVERLKCKLLQCYIKIVTNEILIIVGDHYLIEFHDLGS